MLQVVLDYARLALLLLAVFDCLQDKSLASEYHFLVELLLRKGLFRRQFHDEGLALTWADFELVLEAIVGELLRFAANCLLEPTCVLVPGLLLVVLHEVAVEVTGISDLPNLQIWRTIRCLVILLHKIGQLSFFSVFCDNVLEGSL